MTGPAGPSDSWAGGEGYEAFVGRLSNPLWALFAGVGLRAVEAEGFVVPVDVAGFDDYWAPFVAGTGPAPAYLATLDDAQRAALREAVRERLPVEDDGSIHLTARARAVRGSVPARGG